MRLFAMTSGSDYDGKNILSVLNEYEVIQEYIEIYPDEEIYPTVEEMIKEMCEPIDGGYSGEYIEIFPKMFEEEDR